MRILTGCLFAILVTCACALSYAQTPSSALVGKVYSDKGLVDEATVVLLNYGDSLVVKSTISNKSGIFLFSNISKGKYLVFITKLNFIKSYSGPYEVEEGKSRDIGFISIRQSPTQLGEVVIAGRKDFVEVRKDKSVLNVEQNIMASGASLYDILNTSPGVKIVNDEVLYHGGQRALIAINGKPILLSGEELTNFLKNYQGSSISQIELIDNAGVKYGSTGAGGMINVILKEKKSQGSNVSFTESAAYGDKYKFNSGVNYNLRTEKLNLFASYNYSNNSIPHTIRTNRFIDNNGLINNFYLDYDADVKTSNHNFSLGADYDLSQRQTIGFLVNGFYNNADIDKRNTTYISTNGVRDSSIKSLSIINRTLNNINYNLNYKIDLDKAGKSVLSADADYSDYRRKSLENLRNDFFNAAGQNENDPIFYRDNSPSHITIKSANIDFSQALAKNTRLDLGAKSSRVSNDNQIDFDTQKNSQYVVDSTRTDHFVYTERVDAAYLELESKLSNSTNLTISLRGEHTHFTAESVNPARHADSSYFSLFPNAQLSQQIDKNNLLTLSYSRTIGRPNYQDLNPFISYVDQFYSSTGNPFLRPDFINTYRISDFIADKYRVSLSAIITNNYYQTIFDQDKLTDQYVTIKANLGTRYQYMIEFNLPIDLTPWWHVDAQIDASHERYVYKNYNVTDKSTNNANINIAQNFKLTSKLSAQLVNDYESPTYFVISQYKYLAWTNVGLRYAILNNKGAIRLAVSDVFNSYFNKYTTTFNGLDIYSRDKVGSRFVTATFTYHFGSSPVRAKTKTTEEQKRLSGSAEN
ncbi:TonB-dependent receptor [Mucilaginibacter sp. BT774]|uniref:TonB-dependent receptor domain-containing protein n=1 Tax=Mucilaginibacter sp. BT774 TaxID=3062276 RepID=UPI0026767E02|nr:TonB-dependent receptor [Mucilaginibacter sp. BT774]MDO3624937.1 TonB-dependent receptor [Mucilaginibacter sp. BT774]